MTAVLAVHRLASARLPTRHAEFTAVGYRDVPTGTEHVALVLGQVSGPDPVLTRVQSECLTGEVFGSRRCDCGPQLDEALDRIAARGAGVLVYLRGHEGRGIGLVAKLRAYALQDAGLDTIDANLALGLPVDDRDYRPAAAILRDLGVDTLTLLTNNPDKHRQLTGAGLTVGLEPLAIRPAAEALTYLATKRDRMHHRLDLPVRAGLAV